MRSLIAALVGFVLFAPGAAEAKVFQARSDDFQAAKGTINRSSQEAVDGFNVKVNEFDAAQNACSDLVAIHNVTDGVLGRIAGHPAQRLDELLPWNWRSGTVRLAA